MRIMGPKHPPLLNKVLLGRRVSGARYQSPTPYRSRRLCVEALAAIGCKMSAWTLGEIENGNRAPSVEELIAFTLLLAPPGGIHYFLLPSLPDDIAPTFVKLNCGD